ncbi:MAG TPA: methyltransferase domain-containing protein [Verrucomicrobiae bacterium]|nr:methyltransferase domain-containing protein [Verrucomicrobiae bacterium]
MPTDNRLYSQRFPLASGYHPEWVLAAVSGGANPLWLTEWLSEAMQLRPGMRVLDLGCGRALSSIFLRREFGVQVWAADLWFSAAENLERIRDAGVEEGVFPMHAEARSLPFAPEFFDAVVSIDSFPYYGTDDLYLNYLAGFLKPGGLLGIAGTGLRRELEGEIPGHLREWWAAERPYCLHSADWWRRHWERTEIVDIAVADSLNEGCRVWLEWLRLIAPQNVTEISAVEADADRNLGYVRVVGRKRAAVSLFAPVMSLPAQYTKKPLRRDGE